MIHELALRTELSCIKALESGLNYFPTDCKQKLILESISKFFNSLEVWRLFFEDCRRKDVYFIFRKAVDKYVSRIIEIDFYRFVIWAEKQILESSIGLQLPHRLWSLLEKFIQKFPHQPSLWISYLQSCAKFDASRAKTVLYRAVRQLPLHKGNDVIVIFLYPR